MPITSAAIAYGHYDGRAAVRAALGKRETDRLLKEADLQSDEVVHVWRKDGVVWCSKSYRNLSEIFEGIDIARNIVNNLELRWNLPPEIRQLLDSWRTRPNRELTVIIRQF